LAGGGRAGAGGLIALRAVMGAGAAPIVVLTYSVLPSMFEGQKQERLRAVAILSAITFVGLALGLLAAEVVIGLGMGLVLPAAGDAVVGELPETESGSGFALLRTAQFVALALGVAVLGSIQNGTYRSGLIGHLADLPAPAVAAAQQSVAAAQTLAPHAGSGDARVECDGRYCGSVG